MFCRITYCCGENRYNALTIGFLKTRVDLRMPASAGATQIRRGPERGMQKYPADAKVPPHDIRRPKPYRTIKMGIFDTGRCTGTNFWGKN